MFTQDIWFIQGNQDGCDGKVSREMALSHCLELQKNQAEGVFFNPKNLTRYLMGGTCSALTLNFLEAAVYRPGEMLEARFFTSSQEMRDLQAACNTIEVQPEKGIDFSRNKVQSLLNYFDLKIDQCSEEIDIRKEGAQDKISEIEKSLQGIYFIRIILPSNNRRLEERGHSLGYIKYGKDSTLYDPGKGLIYLENGDSFLFFLFTEYLREYKVFMVRFYKIVLPEDRTDRGVLF